MKKLIVFASAAMLGICAHAAVANWSAFPVFEKGGSAGADNYIGYYIDQAQYSAAMTALTAGTFDGIASIGYVSDTPSMYGGYLAGSNAGNYEKGEHITAYLVVFNASTIADATYAYISQSASGDVGGEGAPAVVDFTSAVVGMKDSGNWYEAKSIPEPTSGLLLLLGVAGLALRRRRA